ARFPLPRGALADGVPEVAVGRIPALTDREVTAYVDKLEAFERSVPKGRTLLIADDADSAGDFPAAAGSYPASLPRFVLPTFVNLQSTDLATARAQLFEAWNGTDLVAYFGHGALDRLTDEGLLLSGDVSTLARADRPPVLASFTCNVARFEVPGFASLGEELVLRPDGGAIAVMAPTGLALHFESEALARVFGGRFYGGGDSLGEAVRDALTSYHAEARYPYTAEIYTLIGDPALDLGI
ncbi:MAG: C25 family cysteine peptidase, partial [Acidobacteriota bacterium]